ncbi:hypothetical protein DFH11DRAFT_474352 [Phellopilus nigrolimitatus]|nr:hypothetical protein DFH11DRAFT_474352 [Phellopilus nigrolimitatus]
MEVPPPLSNTGKEARLAPIELDVGIETAISPMMSNQGRFGRILKAAAISSRAPSNERKSQTSVASPTPASSGAKAVSANFEEFVNTSTAPPSSLLTKEPAPQMNPSTSDIDVVMDISSDSENQSPENLATAVIEHLDGKAPDIMDIDNSEAASASGCASVASPPKDKQETPTSRDASALAIPASALPSSTMLYSKVIELQNASSIIHKCSTKSVFGPSTAVYVSVNIGESTGSTVVMDFELTLNQERQLQLWKMREQHAQDVSNSTCLSLACYKQDDVVDVGFRLNVEDGVLVVESSPSGEKDKNNNSTLCELTPSWPTNSRLSAQIGTSRLFLAPPVQMTEEKFVDLTAFIEGKHIEIRLDHACDMTDYVFALIAHPPTSSQLHVLDEKRTKCKKWRDCLDELRRPFTHAEVFG